MVVSPWAKLMGCEHSLGECPEQAGQCFSLQDVHKNPPRKHKIHLNFEQLSAGRAAGLGHIPC